MVENQQVGARHLGECLRIQLQLLLDQGRVDDGNHAGELGLFSEVGIGDERLQQRARFGHPAGFHHNTVKGHPENTALTFAEEILYAPLHVAPNGTAYAAVVELDDLIFSFSHQRAVDGDLSELVDKDGDALLGILKQMVEDGGFPRPQKPRQHRHRNAAHGQMPTSWPKN